MHLKIALSLLLSQSRGTDWQAKSSTTGFLIELIDELASNDAAPDTPQEPYARKGDQHLATGSLRAFAAFMSDRAADEPEADAA